MSFAPGNIYWSFKKKKREGGKKKKQKKKQNLLGLFEVCREMFKILKYSSQKGMCYIWEDVCNYWNYFVVEIFLSVEMFAVKFLCCMMIFWEKKSMWIHPQSHLWIRFSVLFWLRVGFFFFFCLFKVYLLYGVDPFFKRTRQHKVY